MSQKELSINKDTQTHGITNLLNDRKDTAGGTDKGLESESNTMGKKNSRNCCSNENKDSDVSAYSKYNNSKFWIEDLKILNHRAKLGLYADKSVNYGGVSVLTLAASCGQCEIVEEIVKSRVNVDYMDTIDLVTPLMAASIFGYPHIVKILLNNKANVTLMTNDGNTALHFASRHCHKEIIQFLLEAGADRYILNSSGNSPIMEAYKSPEYNQIREIYIKNEIPIKKSANLENKSKTVNHGKNDNSTSAELPESTLTSIKDFIESNDFVLSIFHSYFTQTSLFGDLSTHKLLLEYAKNSKFPLDHFHHNLAISAHCGHFELVKYMLDNGFKVDKTSNDGITALLEAVRKNRLNIVKELILRGADVNVQSSCGITCLSIASECAYLDMVKLLIQHQANVFSHFSPLVAACVGGCLEIVKIFVGAGCDVNTISELYNSSPLIAASMMGYEDIVTYLLDNGAKIDMCVSPYGTPLISSCEYGRDSVFDILLARGANIEKTDDLNLRNPLSTACYGKHSSLVEKLLALGANPEVYFSNGNTVLMDACRSDKSVIVKMILTAVANKSAQKMNLYIPPDNKNQNSDKSPSQTNLSNQGIKTENSSELSMQNVDLVRFFKCFNKKTKQRKNLIQITKKHSLLKSEDTKNNKEETKNSDLPSESSTKKSKITNEASVIKDIESVKYVNYLSKKTGDTALCLAASIGSADIVALLIANCADIEKCNSNGLTPLMVASIFGHSSVCLQLIISGSNVNSYCKKTLDTALHFAAVNNNVDALTVLLVKGAKINSTNDIGHTPLMLATIFGHVSVMKTLVKYNANLNQANIKKSPLYYACKVDNVECVNILLDGGCELGSVHDENSPFNIACNKNSVNVVKELLPKMGLKTPYRCYPVPMILAAKGNALEVGKFLLETGFDVNSCYMSNPSKQFPIHAAVEKNSTEFLDFLLKNKANVNATNKKKQTALFLAAQSGFEGCVRLLIKAKADVDFGETRDMTPLFAAFKKGHLGVVISLLETAKNIPTEQECKKIVDSVVQDNKDLHEQVRACLELMMEVRRKHELEARKNEQDLITESEAALKKTNAKKMNKKKKKKVKNQDPPQPHIVTQLKPKQMNTSKPEPIKSESSNKIKTSTQINDINDAKFQNIKIKSNNLVKQPLQSSQINSSKSKKSSVSEKIEKQPKEIKQQEDTTKIKSKSIPVHQEIKVCEPVSLQKSALKSTHAKIIDVKNEDLNKFDENTLVTQNMKVENEIKRVKCLISYTMSRRLIGKNGSIITNLRSITKTSIEVDNPRSNTTEVFVYIRGAWKDIKTVLSFLTAIKQEPDRIVPNFIEDIEYIKKNFELFKYSNLPLIENNHLITQIKSNSIAPTISVIDVPTTDSNINSNMSTSVKDHKTSQVRSNTPTGSLANKTSDFESRIKPRISVHNPPISKNSVIWSPDAESYGNNSPFEDSLMRNRSRSNYRNSNLCPGANRPQTRPRPANENFQCPIWNFIHNGKNNVGVIFDKQMWMQTSDDSQPFPSIVYDILDQLENGSFDDELAGGKTEENSSDLITPSKDENKSLFGDSDSYPKSKK